MSVHRRSRPAARPSRVNSRAYPILLAISQAIAGLTDGHAVLATCSAEFRKIVAHDHMDVALIESGGQIHHVYEAWVRTGWSDAPPGALLVDNSPVRAVLRGEVPFLLSGDALQDARFHFPGADDAPIFQHRLRSRIHVPLRVQGAVIGAISVSQQAAEAYGENDVRLAQHCADLLAPYFWALSRAEAASRAATAESEARSREEFLRVGARRLTEGMEKERQRIGMDLHDQTLADLARISRMVATLRQQEVLAGAQLVDVEHALATCLDDLRGIVEDMKPGVLSVFGFSYALEVLLSPHELSVEHRFDWRIDDACQGLVDRLPADTRTALYRIAQEAINNAIVHSRCRFIHVQIERQAGRLVVSVEDDGIGIQKDVLRTAQGGLSHMHTRSKLIGGQVNIGRGHAGRGTRVTIAVQEAGPIEPRKLSRAPVLP